MRIIEIYPRDDTPFDSTGKGPHTEKVFIEGQSGVFPGGGEKELGRGKKRTLMLALAVGTGLELWRTRAKGPDSQTTS